MGRLAALGWIAGAALTHTTADLPSLASMSGIAVVLITSALLMRRFAPNPAGRVPVVLVAIGLTAGSALAGVAYTTWCAQARLADRLAPALEDKVTRVSFRVTGLSADRDGARRFEAQALDSPVPGVPQRILVNWTPPTQWGGETHAKAVADAQGLPEILPGQVWRAALVLRRPHGTVRAYLLQQRLEGPAIYQNPGRQDLTADVNFTDLIQWSAPWTGSHHLQPLAAFLRAAIDPANPADLALTDENGAGAAFLALDQPCAHPHERATMKKAGDSGETTA